MDVRRASGTCSRSYRDDVVRTDRWSAIDIRRRRRQRRRRIRSKRRH